MGRGADFLERLVDHGFDYFTGVPCSYFAGVFPVLEQDPGLFYVEAVREDEAVAQAAGAFLAGRKPVVFMQNSGLGNALNAITSLNQIYGQPFLLVVSWRGFEGKDAPEHLVMGGAMTSILDAIDLPWQVLDPDRTEAALEWAEGPLEEGKPAALIVKKGSLDG